MTLDDLELLYGQILSEFRVISQLWEATTAKRMKTYNVSDGIVAHYMHFSAVYRIRRYLMAFRAKCINMSKTVRDTSKVTISGK